MAGIDLRGVLRATMQSQRLRKRVRLLKPIRPSRANELWYKAQLLALVQQLRRVATEELLPELRAMEPTYAKAGDTAARDSVPRRPLESTFSSMARRFGGIEATAQRLASLATLRNLEATDERLKASAKQSLGIDITPLLSQSGPILSAMTKATAANIELIQSIPAQYFDKLGESVSKNMQAGIRYEDLAREVMRIGDVTESRAKLIARDQTSKMNGAFNRARQTSIGLDRYKWQTSGDERVRDNHAANDGKVFRWDDPPETGHPGEDVNCRCVAIPYFDLDGEEERLGL
jgi:SPP1 gp7 family putative phage head morphogenesis protein